MIYNPPPYPPWNFIPFAVCGLFMGHAVATLATKGFSFQPLLELAASLFLWFVGRTIHHRYFAQRYAELERLKKELDRIYGRRT